MIYVSVYPDTLDNFVSQVYAGLFDLRADGKIQLNFTSSGFSKRSFRFHPLTRATLCLEVASDQKRVPVKVFIDLADGDEIGCPVALEWSDVCFKSCYRQPSVNLIEERFGRKLLPFGLNYACTSIHERATDRIRCAILRNHVQPEYAAQPFKQLMQIIKQPMKLQLKKYEKIEVQSNLPFYTHEIEVAPDVPADPKIYYRTRVYAPESAPISRQRGLLEYVNNFRADTIRALKEHFGDRFVGGIRSTAFADKYYSDCIFQETIGWRGHIEKMQSILINVTTSGLHDAIDWKLAEYYAASRCVVTQRLKSELPLPLIEGKHLLSFDTPEESVSACERILSNPDLAMRMRSAGHQYYHDHSRPEQTMRRCLQLALNS